MYSYIHIIYDILLLYQIIFIRKYFNFHIPLLFPFHSSLSNILIFYISLQLQQLSPFKSVIYFFFFYLFIYYYYNHSSMKSYKTSIFPIIQSDIKLNKLYHLHKKLSNGCFGYLFLVTNKLTNRTSALKIQLIKNNHVMTLPKQFHYLKKLSGIKGITNVYNFGKTDKLYYMQLDLLETDINCLANKTIKADYAFICQIAVNILEIFEKIHSKNIVHRDIKPQNIMLDKNNNIYLIDFGISKQMSKRQRFENQKNKKNYKKISFVGTPRYASINAHKGKQQSALDDIQSLMYNLIFLMKKSLPWMNIHVDDDTKLDNIMMIKLKKTKSQLFKDLPKCIQTTFQYINNLEDENQIDYKYLISLFKFQTQKQFKSQNLKSKSKSNKQSSFNHKPNRRTSLESNNNFLALPIIKTSSSQNSLQIPSSQQVLISNRSIQKQDYQISNIEQIQTAEERVQDKIRNLQQRHLIPRFKIKLI